MARETMSAEDVLQLVQGGAAQDERLFVKFNVQPVQNDLKSDQEGRPIFDDVVYIRIAQPGDPTNMIHRAVTKCGGRRQCNHPPNNKCDLHRFPRAYAAFMGDLDQDGVSGTPLSALPFLSVGQVEELKHLHCNTVEQLAELADSNVHNFAPIQKLKQQAQAFLEAARGGAPLIRMQALLDSRDEQLQALKYALEQQKAQIDQLIRAQAAPSLGTTPQPAPVPAAIAAPTEPSSRKRGGASP